MTYCLMYVRVSRLDILTELQRWYIKALVLLPHMHPACASPVSKVSHLFHSVIFNLAASCQEEEEELNVQDDT